MIIILPIGQDELVLSRLPFATFVLMAACIVASLVGGAVVTDAAEKEARALATVRTYYEEHDYLELPPDILEVLPQRDRILHEYRQEWLEWLAAAPDEAASLVESTPTPRKGKGTVSMLDATGEVVQVSQAERPSRAPSEEELASIKAQFLGRAMRIDEDRRYEEQRRLDDLAEGYRAAVERSAARRFAFVPTSPSPIGLVTHIFIHGGVWHLVFNLLFLWIVATKLEDIWGRPLFVAAFVVFGILGALVHALANPDSTAPMVGASGAVAGLMGAYVVRLARTKIKFVYFYMILKPKYGIFDAPAFLIFPLWFFGELVYALFLDFGGVAYWAHVGGFAAGVLLAVALKLSDFERRVLGREPEVRIDPDAMPLVAFQRPTAGEAGPAGTGPRALDLAAATIESLADDRLECATADGSRFSITRGQVTVLAAAQVGRVDGPLAERWLRVTEPRTSPTVLMVLLVKPAADPSAAPASGYVIDAARLRYNRLFEEPLPTPRDNFFTLIKKVTTLFPGARFVGDRERLAAGDLPAYPDLRQLEARLVQASR